ncbi:UPF0042 nucleotide-binding protein [Rhodothalassium salexigens DSM 2132]|uniref:UPF0042 nucleotide-binding protein n=1 Tax=Rhodothalassium salexigens DSM 2132 TaxID=1188247 RepID=A0A4R2PN79_RHOSA|nr:RNase adapter RapZ [Rhodothalassium salexigens]MBB4210958.1 UPF0042 nucleotide-binding protein [Rhodothalassium salexigens DSM 2132]MBK1638690.1 RNase adaptor protein RapZ [Rhodothalassium salexigens DSM 2132]TCP36384.1 UPF0042 nucleotide-binding protein [Rhodothalassium salexigens DSM 2132]
MTETDLPSRPPVPVVLVTGLSGAGKSTGLKALEDLGYDVVDNLSIALVPSLIDLARTDAEAGAPQPMAVGLDSRTRDFSTERVAAQIDVLRARDDVDLSVVFFDCDDATLARRYSETRRPHPMAHDRPIRDGVQRERTMLAPIRAVADLVLDTTDQTSRATRQRMELMFKPAPGPGLMVMVMSFAFKRGVPRDADLVFDVRFLRNPHYDDRLRERTGLEDEVAAYVQADRHYRPFMDKLTDLVSFLLPQYMAEGKHYLTLAIGCTGGQHRSVAISEALARDLRQAGHAVQIMHRELVDAGRERVSAPAQP